MSTGLSGATKRFQRAYGLSRRTLITLLRANGVPTANPVTLARWEGGQTAPSVASEQMWLRGLSQVQETLEAALATTTPPQDPFLAKVVTALRARRKRR